jgi:hypothetical protein
MNIKTLLPELRKLVTGLADDLLVRSTSDATIDAGLREAFELIKEGQRTAQAFEVWRDDYLDQVAVAWVLACVFVRFIEDNQLIDECWLAGDGPRRRLADDTHEIFFRQHPHDTDREYFQHVFKEVGKIPAAKDLFAEGKTPLWAVAPSGDAAMNLLKFWREIDPATGTLRRRFNHEIHETHERIENDSTSSSSAFPSSSSFSPSSFRVFSVFRGSDPTRFLGDLYQELSEKAKKKYALLQTPVFVEEFILDRTLTPALDEFGLEKVRMIDPTCGSGHFLLGGFARLFDLWCRRESNEIVAAQKALDGVWGVDINPFAVAIARFRLIVAAVQACGIKRLKQAPGWKIHLATGDSLLFGSRWNRSGEKVTEQGWFASDEGSWAPEVYACEDKDGLESVLGQQYHVVVGNPPYIIVRDRTLNAAYRNRYPTCHQKYSLAVPFAERFFDLCLSATVNAASGYVGQITANSFMKREFGKKLIEEFFPKIDLTHVIDTSGAYIPGHGTPTAILFGRNRAPSGGAVRAVMGIKGEPSTPDDASQGRVWRSILHQIDRADSQDEFTSAVDVPRAAFNSHPWSIGGGGVADVMESIGENTSLTLSQITDSIGITCFTLEDDVYIIPWEAAARLRINRSTLREMVVGDSLRDWAGARCGPAIFPYDEAFRSVKYDLSSHLFRFLWAYSTNLANSKMFGSKTKVEAGLQWYEFGRLTHNKLRTPLSIAFAFVATHNHFVLDRGGKVYNRSAPIIKLPADATEDDHLAFLGLLNSSTACFWMKQVFYPKASAVGDISTDKGRPEANRYEFTGTGLLAFPLPKQESIAASQIIAISRNIDDLARRSSEILPEILLRSLDFGDNKRSLPDILDQAAIQYEQMKKRMIALQEELDWEVYKAYGLTDVGAADAVLSDVQHGISREQRPFLWANDNAPSDLHDSWSGIYGHRRSLLSSDPNLKLIETLVFKRPWWGRQGVYGQASRTYKEWIVDACRDWLLDRLENTKYRKGMKDRPELTTTAQMADVASADAEFLQVAAIYRGRPDFNVAALVAELVEAEAVPFLPILRYKPAGLRKREIWERTWELQREENRDQTTKHTKHTKEDQETKTEKEDQGIQIESESPDLFRVFRGSTLDSSSITDSTTKHERGDPGSETESDSFESLSLARGNRGSTIPVPPKYTSTDFLKTDFWRLRGKLDVPKERWISYPHCSTESDPTLVVGWAGWNHLEQATALVAYYDARKREGWDAKRLTPLLAGLDQLLPWIHQWHPEIDPEFGETAGQSFQTMLEHDAHELGLTLEDIRKWTPPEKPKKTSKGRKKKVAAEDEE